MSEKRNLTNPSSAEARSKKIKRITVLPFTSRQKQVKLNVMDKGQFFQKLMKQFNIHMPEKKNLNQYLKPYRKINSKRITDLNIRGKTLNFQKTT